MDFEMSDEDFLQQSAPVVEEAAAPAAPTQEELDAQARLDQEDADREAAEQAAATDGAPVPQPGDADYVEPTSELKPGDEGYVEPEPVKEGDEGKPTSEPVVEAAAPIDYKAAYENMMKPLRANGKDIELRSPDELIKLAQQGANFTLKSQQLAPYRKVLQMLQNNDLLSEDKLTYLIDLDKRNPEAIKKLLTDSGIDPMDIDTSVPPAYTPGNHKVSNEEANFQSALDDMSASDEGKATLHVINTSWDQASKDMLWSNPEIMGLMLEQKKSGIYDTISTEIDRQRMLGQIPANMSFLTAYKTVGDQMVAQEVAAKQAAVATPAPAPVARTAPVKPAATESDRAKAASMTRTTPRQAKVVVNPLGMSDDDFLKQFNGRL